jgi:hypothetical protein
MLAVDSRNWHSWHYWKRLLLFFGLSIVIILVSLPLLQGILLTLALLYVPCSPVHSTPADFGLDAESLTLPASAGGNIRAYYISSKNGAVVIIPPAYNGDRNSRLFQAAMLNRHGYGVFLFDSRRCAGMGPHSLGYQEVAEVGDALTYVSSRTDVDPDRIGVHGFSSAGATAIMAAAKYRALRAVVAEGGYGDYLRHALGGYDPTLNSAANLYLVLHRVASRVTYRLVIGSGMEKLSPLSAIGDVAPRPVLLIYGSLEPSLGGGREQAVACDCAELWVVPDAWHGGYQAVAPTEYEARIIAFFNDALLKTKLE